MKSHHKDNGVVGEKGQSETKRHPNFTSHQAQRDNANAAPDVHWIDQTMIDSSEVPLYGYPYWR